MNTASKRSLGTRIRERFRYGLAIQEVLDSLQRRLRILVVPYFLVVEGLQPDFTPSEQGAQSFEIRFLDDADMESLAKIRTNLVPLARLKKTLGHSKCLGIFVDGRLAGYTWGRVDVIPTPNTVLPLVVLDDGEAYLFDALVSRDFRGYNLAPIVRQQLYRELQKIGKTRFYSITLAFNRSSRRFKAKLGAKEIELRLTLGISRWRAIDMRLKSFEGGTRAPSFRLLKLEADTPKDT